MVKGRSSPDDPDLTGYWENRRRKKTGLALDAGTLSLLARQENKCPHCGDPLIDASTRPPHPRNGKTGGSASPARTSPPYPARRDQSGHRKNTEPPSP